MRSRRLPPWHSPAHAAASRARPRHKPPKPSPKPPALSMPIRAPFSGRAPGAIAAAAHQSRYRSVADHNRRGVEAAGPARHVAPSIRFAAAGDAVTGLRCAAWHGGTRFLALTQTGATEDEPREQLFHEAISAENWRSFGKSARVRFLQELRAKDAAAGLTLLEACFAQEPAALRSELAFALRAGLSAGGPGLFGRTG